MKINSLVKKITAVLAAAVIAATLFIVPAVYAMWDTAKAVHIISADVENSTIIIGTHLIHISALTDNIYDTATASAIASEQSSVYYKSELAEGTWFDISSAQSLTDISTGGVPVTNESIDALFFTHHTRSDGITYDLLTGKPVNIFDIISPYDLLSLEELSPLKMRYEIMQQLNSTEAVEAEKLEITKAFFETDMHTPETDVLDAQLNALNIYFTQLNQSDAPADKINAVQNVMASVDAARRFIVFEKLSEMLAALTDKIFNHKDYKLDTEWQAGVNDSATNVTTAGITHQGNRLSEGINISSAVTFELSVNLINEAAAADYTACEKTTVNLMAMQSIMNSKIADKAAEQALLDYILKRSEKKLTDLLWAGTNEEYAVAAAKNLSSALKNNIVKKAAGELNAAKSEQEFFVSAQLLRLETSASLTYIDGEIAKASKYFDNVKIDAFENECRTAINNYIDFLKKERRKAELAAGGNDTDKLLASKASLKQDMLAALDKNNLLEAKNIQNKLGDIDGLLNENGEGDIGDLAASLLTDILSALNSDEHLNRLASQIKALCALAPDNYNVVMPQLTKIHEELSVKIINGGTAAQLNAYREGQQLIEQALVDNKVGYEAAMRTELNSDDIAKRIDDFLNSSGLDINRFDIKSSIIIALNMYYEETKSMPSLQKMHAMATEEITNGNPYIYGRLPAAQEYVPLNAIAAYKNYRYVWQSNTSVATLAAGRKHYTFTLFSQKVSLGTDEPPEEMSANAGAHNSVMHIPSDYSSEKFEISAVYLEQCGNAAMASDEILSVARQLLAILLE